MPGRQFVWWLSAAALVSVAGWTGARTGSAADRAETAAPLTPASVIRPIRLAYLPHAQQLLVANRDAGTISTLDAVAYRKLADWRVPAAEQLSDMLVSNDEQTVVVCSRTQNRVWCLTRTEQGAFRVLTEAEVPAGPVGLCWIRGNEKQPTAFAVASQWGRTVTCLTVPSATDPRPGLQSLWSVGLPHAPRRLLLLPPGDKLLAADAFGGAISTIDVAQGQLERTKQLPGHNLGGLGLMPDGKRVIVAHQILNPVAETSRDGVFWGIVMSNNIRMVPVENFLRDDRKPLQEADIHFLGEPNHGAADPSAIALARYDTMLTTLGGVDELAVGVHLDHSFDRVRVGRNPVDVATNASGEIAFVANQFSDSVSVVEIKLRKVIAEIDLRDGTPPPPLTLAQQGEILFHDGKLSLDSWYSCHSCHTHGHTAGLLNDNLGDGNYGAPKRIPTLLGVADTAPFLWSGRRDDLIEQSRKSITTTMHGPDPTEEQLQALAAYMETLAPPPRINEAPPEQVARGQQIFQSRGCDHCHPAPAFTAQGVYDVGLKDQHGRTEFNPPSLRGVRYRGPYFHDLRAATLNDVFVKHQHPEPSEWSETELADLIAYLRSL